LLLEARNGSKVAAVYPDYLLSVKMHQGGMPLAHYMSLFSHRGTELVGSDLIEDEHHCR